MEAKKLQCIQVQRPGRFASVKHYENALRFVKGSQNIKLGGDVSLWAWCQAWAKGNVDLTNQSADIKTKALMKSKFAFLHALEIPHAFRNTRMHFFSIGNATFILRVRG